MNIKNKKNLKPIDTDVHFKYQCTNPDCGAIHWLSLKESQTKNYKIVCDCGSIFIPKRIQNIKIIFLEIEKPKPEKVEVTEEKIDVDLIARCAKVLVGYGFTDQESEDLLIKSHKQNPQFGSAELIKFALQSFGE